MTKMFTYQGRRMVTWNPFTGCGLNGEGFCAYNCWARRLINTRLKLTPKYKDCGFKPTFHPNELNKTFKPDDFVFITSLGDISFCQTEDIEKILKVIKKYPKTNFLFCTKNPHVYEVDIPYIENVYYGATIETNRDTSKFSKAPLPEARYETMKSLPQNYKRFLSIEPICDFDCAEFLKWILDIEPAIVEIGFDNYKSGLPQPSIDKVQSLIDDLRQNEINVIEKDGLSRLLKT